MATRLAQCGILTCVVSYTLYPQAKARDMVAELSQALTWTLDNINTFGGDPKQAGLVAYEASVISGVTRICVRHFMLGHMLGSWNDC